MNCCIRRHVEMVVGTNKSYAIGMNRNGVFKMQAEPRLCGIFLTVGRTLDLPSAINTELLKTTCCTVDDLPSRFRFDFSQLPFSSSITLFRVV